MGSPVSVDVNERIAGQAVSFTIGSFDLSAFGGAFDAPLPLGASDYSSDSSSLKNGMPHNDLLMRLAAVLQPPLAAFVTLNGVLEWPAPLLNYQRDGIAALLARPELLLADDMGLGKTIQAIAALRILFFRREVSNALVVCPASLMRQWQRELKKWAPELIVVALAAQAGERGGLWRIPAHIRLISYETLRIDVMEVRDSPAVRQAWDVVVLDEASRIKNRESGIAMACKKLPRKRRWALTGTPLENRTDDVLSIFEFLIGNPGERARLPVTDSGIKHQLKMLQLRRKKEDVLPDLPPRTVIELPIELPASQRISYDLAEQDGVVNLTKTGAALNVTHVLELISRLKQLCNFDPVSGESGKLADISQRLQTLVSEGHRALIFSQFTDNMFGVGRIVETLKEFAPLAYTGAMSSNRKNEIVDTFTADSRHKALVLSLRAGGVGLNLQAASYVFHLDRWWNPAIEEQADSRAHRMGQQYPVTVFRYVCADTIEERIQAKLTEKRRLFADIVDDVTLDIGAALSEAELFGLFGLAAPRTAAKSEGDFPADFAALSGEDFENWLAENLRGIGFEVHTTPQTRDGGIDLIAVRADSLNIETRLLIQCKNAREPAGVAVVRELRGVTSGASSGSVAVVASPAGFSADAREFAEHNGVRLWGRDELRELRRQAQRNMGK